MDITDLSIKNPVPLQSNIFFINNSNKLDEIVTESWFQGKNKKGNFSVGGPVPNPLRVCPWGVGGGAPALVGKNNNILKVIVYAAGRCGAVRYRVQVYSHNCVLICTKRITDMVHIPVKNIFILPSVTFYYIIGIYNSFNYSANFIFLRFCRRMQITFTYIYGNTLCDTFCFPLTTVYYILEIVYQTSIKCLEYAFQMLKPNFRVRCLFTVSCLVNRQFPLPSGGHCESCFVFIMVSEFFLTTTWQAQLM